ncbi:hypothetical protein MKX03_015700, partial [Papaver bracteatum]
NKVEKEAVNKRAFDLEAENTSLKAEVNREKSEKILAGLKREEILAGIEALEKQVSDLTSKIVQCCGAVSGGSEVEKPQISGNTVPSNWVTFGELDVLASSKNTSFAITKSIGGSNFRNDKTTNVHPSCFYRGLYPIVVVDVAELTPNREKARFDPCVWGLYDNAGVIYAARKPFASEMSVDAYKKC